MTTTVLRRSPAEFWEMTLREIVTLISEYSRIEALKGKADALRIGYAVACYQVGKVPFQDEPEEGETRELTVDEAFDLL
jgi:hypothetical protein